MLTVVGSPLATIIEPPSTPSRNWLTGWMAGRGAAADPGKATSFGDIAKEHPEHPAHPHSDVNQLASFQVR
jgi:hypothetical protein